VLAVLLLVLIPGPYESKFINNAYHQHPGTMAMVIVVLALAFGWWVRNLTEVKLKKPHGYDVRSEVIHADSDQSKSNTRQTSY
jgi:hypothetical protein